MGKIVRFYRAQDGKIPVEDFLNSLPAKVAQKVLWVLMVATAISRMEKHAADIKLSTLEKVTSALGKHLQVKIG